ncbi:hypothetical protein GTQ40_08245 [Flavobacteriaceae bacterium R38]|nr:hypothetical protein [Flavobacteriaceae bacterium R38]
MGDIKDIQWNISQRIYLRFIFLYLLFYIYPYGFEYIQELNTRDISFWPGITTWFGETFLGWEFDKENLLNGFDSKYDYSRFILIALLSVIGTSIWLFIDAKIKRDYNARLNILIKTILRYHIGLTLIIYGLSKVLMLQFGEMDFNRLETTMGNQTGMSFLWAFMSYSKFYTMSTGWIELIGGILLLFRKSTFIGAFILFIAMANVVLIDIGYDVRVKMFAIHLFLMTLILLGDNLKRLYRFFILNTTTKPVEQQALFSNPKAKKIGYSLKGILLLYFVTSSVIIYTDRSAKRTNRYPTVAGFHTVEMMIKNNDTISEINDQRWKNLSISGSSYRPETAVIREVSGRRNSYSFEADTLKKTMILYSIRGNRKAELKLKYKELNHQEFIFEGTHQSDSIWIKTTSKTLKDYPLTANEIRWITDLR